MFTAGFDELVERCLVRSEEGGRAPTKGRVRVPVRASIIIQWREEAKQERQRQEEKNCSLSIHWGLVEGLSWSRGTVFRRG